ncbi:MAG: CoA pyrophosphatase [Clostridia bacterium]|nr:CoA pyrophosphatase [Deltaproteobacteria bacterium]
MTSRTTLVAVSAKLVKYRPRYLPVASCRRAAVLVPLRVLAGTVTPGSDPELELILTRRSADLAKHSGQVAFPGGAIDAADPTPEDTALREAFEELGLGRNYVRVLGRLDDVLSNTGFHCVPVVGLVAPEATLKANPAEVARIFSVPLADLAVRERWELRPIVEAGRPHELPHFFADGEDIWGLTATVLLRLAELL